MSFGQPVMVMLARAHILGLLTKACWYASFLSGGQVSIGHGDVLWDVRSRAEPREHVRQGHFLTRVVMDGVIIALEAQWHVL